MARPPLKCRRKFSINHEQACYLPDVRCIVDVRQRDDFPGLPLGQPSVHTAQLLLHNVLVRLGHTKH